MNLFLEVGTSGESSVAMFVVSVRFVRSMMRQKLLELWSYLNRRDAGHKRAGSEQGCVTGHKYLYELHNQAEACVTIKVIGRQISGCLIHVC
jgi:hypothetical protein